MCVCLCVLVKDFMHLLLQLVDANYFFWPKSYMVITFFVIVFSEVFKKFKSCCNTEFLGGLLNVLWQQRVISLTQCNLSLQWENIEPSNHSLAS